MTPEQIKQTRKELGLTQEQLARELGLSFKHGGRTIRRIEKGEAIPSDMLLTCFKYYIKLKKIENELSQNTRENE